MNSKFQHVFNSSALISTPLPVQPSFFITITCHHIKFEKAEDANDNVDEQKFEITEVGTLDINPKYNCNKQTQSCWLLHYWVWKRPQFLQYK